MSRGDDDIIKVVNDIAAHFGGLDIIVNNAGISVRVAIDDDGYDDAWTKGLAVMLTAHPRIVRAALPSSAPIEMPADRQYRLHRGARRYRIAQSLFRGEGRRHRLTRSLAVELGREGITVNCICPGRSAPRSPSGFPRSTRRSTPSAAPRSAATATPRRSRT
jgi:3-oxoacyl-[acyl-carrier protein] reductase